MSLIFGILKEVVDKRVSIVPKTCQQLTAAGIRVMVEAGAGAQAGFGDQDYQTAGGVVKTRKEVIEEVQFLLSIHPLPANERQNIAKGTYLLSQFQPYFDKTIVGELKAAELHAFSMDMIPRSTIAQRMDVLSSMANLAGHQAVLLASTTLPRFLPMMITAAGSIKPAKVLILGAGVAGLQAIATAKRLGAIVEAFDVRAAAKEEVQSLGGRFVEVEGATDDQDAGGYAVQQTEAYKRKQAETIHQHASAADIIITTAQLRGRTAPILITAETVAAMKPGSVIVDLAASTGGNCELTQDNQTIVEHGVTIIGNSNLAQDLAQDASVLYSNNVFNFLQVLIKEGELVVDMDNDIIKSTLITA
ncbi:MAG: NAD(P) transhydrogenase subunit alpha [Bacteroidota bacterium]